MRARMAVAGCVALSLVGAGAGRAAAVAPPSASMRDYIVVLHAGFDAQDVARQQSGALGGNVEHVYSHALDGYAASLPTDRVDQLAHDPRVEAVVPNRTWHLADQVNGAAPIAQEVPTGVRRINGDHSSARSGDGRGSVPVNVAVIDTGIDTNNPDLNVVGGTNCATPDGSYNDDIGHGTHVAGTIGARDDRQGVVGVAPGVRLYAVRVFDANGDASDESVLCGIDWVTATRTDHDPTNDIAVANMSIGNEGTGGNDCGGTEGDFIHAAVCRAAAAGVTLVAAAGNDSESLGLGIPGSYPEVLTVTAMTDIDGRPGGHAGTSDCLDPQFPVTDDAAAFFSSFATTVDQAAHTVAAPGVCIDSTVPGGIYNASGTSMSTPHVTGVVALCIAYGPCRGLRPAQIVRRVRNDALVYTLTHPSYGFAGDPLRPIPGQYYGPLVNAAIY